MLVSLAFRCLVIATATLALRNDDDGQGLAEQIPEGTSLSDSIESSGANLVLDEAALAANRVLAVQQQAKRKVAAARIDSRTGTNPSSVSFFFQKHWIEIIIGSVVCLLAGYFVNITGALVVAWFFIALLYYTTENIDYVSSVYAAVQIITTVGYGDVLPTTDEGKLTLCMLILVSTLVISAAVSDICDAITAWQERHTKSLFDKMLKDVEERKAEGAEAEADKAWISTGLKLLISSTVPYAFMTFLGAYYYSVYEGCTCSFGFWKIDGCEEGPQCAFTGGTVKTQVDAFYMAIMTLSTVGFGDFGALSRQGRMFAIFWMLFGVGAMVSFVTAFGNWLHQSKKEPEEQKAKVERVFRIHDQNNNGKLTKLEFLQFQLEMNGMVDSHCMAVILKQFDTIDTSRDGMVSLDEVKKYCGKGET
jgi:potassium channel subfamily K